MPYLPPIKPPPSISPTTTSPIVPFYDIPPITPPPTHITTFLSYPTPKYPYDILSPRRPPTNARRRYRVIGDPREQHVV